MWTAGAAAAFCFGENQIGTMSLIAGSKHHQTSQKTLQAECGLHFQPSIHSIHSHSLLICGSQIDRLCLLLVRIPDYYFIRRGLTERQTGFLYVFVVLLYLLSKKMISDICLNVKLK